jgi:hypothetical protein
MLAIALRGIVCQRLIPRTDGSGRVAAIEIMINSPSIKQLIEKGQIADIQKSIESSQSYYRMQSFNQSLSELVRKRLITEDDAMANTTAPGDLKLMLKGMVRAGGTSAIPKEEVEAAIGADDVPAADPKASSGAIKVIIPAPKPATANAATTSAVGMRAPIRPTGRQGTPAAQRPVAPAATPAQPGAAPAGEKPKINRGFDFQK